jgi:hypothetical protein
MGLEHYFLYVSADIYNDNLYKSINYRPLSINNQIINQIDYIDIEDNLIHYFHDYFKWVDLYNPCKKENVKGFCYWGVTTIYGEPLIKINNIIKGILSIFLNAPQSIVLKGNYTLYRK